MQFFAETAALVVGLFVSIALLVGVALFAGALMTARAKQTRRENRRGLGEIEGAD